MTLVYYTDCGGVRHAGITLDQALRIIDKREKLPVINSNNTKIEIDFEDQLSAAKHIKKFLL